MGPAGLAPVGIQPVFMSASSSPGPSSPTVTVTVVQSVAFTSPSSPAYGPSAPALAPQSPSLAVGGHQVCVVGPGHLPESSSGTGVVQQKLDQTSTCLAAALKAVERKLEDDSDR